MKERDSEDLEQKKIRVRSTKLETADIDDYFLKHHNEVKESLGEDENIGKEDEKVHLEEEPEARKNTGVVHKLFGKIRERVGRRVSSVHSTQEEEKVQVETTNDIEDGMIETDRYTIT